jgi:hypothetical protein
MLICLDMVEHNDFTVQSVNLGLPPARGRFLVRMALSAIHVTQLFSHSFQVMKMDLNFFV